MSTLLPKIVFLFCVVLFGTAVVHGASMSIEYKLPRSAQVSVVITDANGKVVRELLHAARRAGGAHAEPWDGLNDAGQPASAGKYRWKLLATQGLTAEYLLTLGT